VKRPENLIYGVAERPPPVQLALLALQQVALVSIYLVLMVIVVREAGAPPEAARSALSFGMIAMGIGAVLQAIWKGPVGSGYLAPPVLSAIYLQVSVTAAQVGGLPLVAGMTILAGAFEAIVLPPGRRRDKRSVAPGGGPRWLLALLLPGPGHLQAPGCGLPHPAGLLKKLVACRGT
jgi:xanthine/uracil permease